MTILGFALTVCFVCGWTGFAVPSGWVLLSICLPILYRRVPFNWFLAYACLAIAWAPLFPQAIWDLWVLLLLSWAWAFGREVEIGGLFRGMGWGLAVSSAIGVAQLLGWDQVYYVGQHPAGLFVNANILGEVAVLTSVGLVTRREWWPLLGSVPALALSGSRLAILVAIVCGCLWWRPPWWALVGLAVAFAGVFVVLHKGAGSSSYRVFESTEERIAVWSDTAEGLVPFGHGPGSFLTLYPAYAKRTDTFMVRPMDAHNDFLQLAFQYGLGAILLVPALALAWGPLGPERMVFLAFLLIATFAYPMAVPAEGFVGAFCLGRLFALRDVAREHSRRGRPCRERWVREWKRWRARLGPASVPLEPVYPNEARLPYHQASPALAVHGGDHS